MCLGKITGERKKAMYSNNDIKQEYLNKAKKQIDFLISLGVNTFLFISWDYYDVLMCKMLKDIDAMHGGCFNFIMPIGVILKGEKILKHPNPDQYFQLIIDQASERIDLPDEVMADELIENVEYLLYDEKEMNGHIPLYLEKAKCKKLVILSH